VRLHLLDWQAHSTVYQSVSCSKATISVREGQQE
jgi:hypothetical protein